MTLNCVSLNFQRILRDFADFGRNNSQTNEDRPVLSEQRCKHVELEQFLACFRVARVCQRFLVFDSTVNSKLIIHICRLRDIFGVELEIRSFRLQYSSCRRPAEERPAIST